MKRTRTATTRGTAVNMNEKCICLIARDAKLSRYYTQTIASRVGGEIESVSCQRCLNNMQRKYPKISQYPNGANVFLWRHLNIRFFNSIRCRILPSFFHNNKL